MPTYLFAGSFLHWKRSALELRGAAMLKPSSGAQMEK